ncbi:MULTISPECIES: hypothetical protein [unclassified Microbacterium]|uniref:hypothetical protein n=1 Tax=unclassified Microbacterium TaxID=2609290 RepID=UPI003018B29E
MIEQVMLRLLAASQLAPSGARVAGYVAALVGAPPATIASVVAVLAEGAIHGPDAARKMAHEFGG